jgi:hypothetical protein
VELSKPAIAKSQKSSQAKARSGPRSTTPGLRFTQELTTFTNLYGIFTPALRLFTPLYASLQITFCKTTTQISDHINLVVALARSRSGY